MLRNLTELEGYVLLAKDGDIGRCKDFLFDDRHWTVRYMVADTGKWLPGKKVLISPISLGEPDWKSQRFPVSLTKEMIENSPPLGFDEPVSRKLEENLFDYYGLAFYWGGTGIWGPGIVPKDLITSTESKNPAGTEAESAQTSLRSADEVKGYHIRAKDDEVGHVEDFILDDRTWTLRYLVVDTRNWLPGRKVLISPQWIKSIDWASNIVDVDMNREEIENSPAYDPSSPVKREYETQLYDYFGRPKYW